MSLDANCDGHKISAYESKGESTKLQLKFHSGLQNRQFQVAELSDSFSCRQVAHPYHTDTHHTTHTAFHKIQNNSFVSFCSPVITRSVCPQKLWN